VTGLFKNDGMFLSFRSVTTGNRQAENDHDEIIIKITFVHKFIFNL
jgi:hypothetical protein